MINRIAAALVLLMTVGGLTGARAASAGELEAPPARDEARPGIKNQAGPQHLIAWSPKNLPRKTERALDRIDGVRATTVSSALGWMTSSRAPGGRRVDKPPRGYAIPLDVAFVKPGEYAAFVKAEERDPIRSLRRREALFSETEVRLREGHRKLKMRVSGQRVRTSGVVGDRAAQGYEALMRAPVPQSWGKPIRSVLIRKDASVPRKRIKRAVRRSVNRGHPLQIRSEEQTRWLHYAEVVRPQAFIKKAMGEFAARPSSGGRLQIQSGWVRKHIDNRRVPILGRVTCHRRLFPQLRGALRELRKRGLSHLIDRDEYAGCYNPRFIATAPGTRISRHSWGIALDINREGNEFGAKPHQDRRLVRVMRKWGFTWGGPWPIPDGMHFEWIRFP